MLKKLRSRLFGFKKSDVYSYIAEMDERASEQLEKKDEEIAELKARLAEREERIAELEKNREAIVEVLLTADRKAKEIVNEAQQTADSMRAEAEREIKDQKETVDREITEQKNNVNREIEIKRKAIKNYYATENKKIDQIKSEVDRMRQASLDAIQNFERQLREVERMTVNSSSYIDSAKEYAVTESVPESFSDVERNIPVHFVESISD